MPAIPVSGSETPCSGNTCIATGEERGRPGPRRDATPVSGSGTSCSGNPCIATGEGGGRPGTRRDAIPASGSGRMRAFVHKMFIKYPEGRSLFGELFLYLLSCKVLRRRLSARDQKGTPVKIRDYSRSCKPRCIPHTLEPLSPGTGRRAEGASQKTCLAGKGNRLRDLGRYPDLFIPILFFEGMPTCSADAAEVSRDSLRTGTLNRG